MDIKKTVNLLSQELKIKRKEFIHLCKLHTLGVISARNYALLVKDVFRKTLIKMEFLDKNWCLVGVGGFGRGELSFASDLDLLFLYKRKLNKELEQFIKKMVQSLWDHGFEVGHRVLKPDEVKKIIKEDFPSLTSVLQTTFLGGDNGFYNKWRKDFFNFFFSSQKKKKNFLSFLISLRDERFKKYGDSSYIIEPHVKEGQGGLRDIHTIRWLMKVFFNVLDPAELVKKEILLNVEREWLQEAENFLWRVRLQLHRLTNKAFDRLTLEYQKELARCFLSSKNSKNATEEFMGHYYRQCARIRRLSEFLLEKVKELRGNKKIEPKKLESFLIYNNHIKFSNPALIPSKPLLLMEIFWRMAKMGLHFHHETGQIIRKNLSLLSNKHMKDKMIIKQFFDILLNPKHSFHTLYTMMETGFLDKFIPDFSHIRYKVQYDTYHTYTVDEHLLRTVQELHKMNGEEKYQSIFKQTERYKKILFLAGLLHDIGKGYNKDHSKYGAVLCKNIGNRLKLESEEIELLYFLVEKHLLLIHIALKRDLSEEKPIETCVLEVEDKLKLHLLYLLTVADSRATGPNAWNLWKSSLLDELLIKAERFMETQKWDLKDAQRVKLIKKETLSKTPEKYKDEISTWFDSLSIRYILNTPIEEILLHFKLEKNLKDQKLHLIPKKINNEVAEVTIVCYDREDLFDIITGVFWAYGLNILAANVHTRPYRVVVDKIIVKNIPDFSNWDRLWSRIKRDMLLILNNHISLEEFLSKKEIRRVISPKSSALHKKSKVIIDNNASDFYTVIEVYSWDRPGLLLKISKTLHKFKLNIFMAKISTLGSQVADVFYVTNTEGEKLTEEEKLKELEKAIIKGISL